MSIDIKVFKRYPLYPEGVEVTEENKEEVAKWCGGTVKSFGDSFYIHVPVMRPMNKRQSRANVGDHVLRLGGGFKVYTPTGMLKSFRESDLAEKAADEDLARFEEIKLETAREGDDNGNANDE